MTDVWFNALEFHSRFNRAVGGKPATPSATLLNARLTFLAEEFFEIFESCGIPDSSLQVAKAAVAACIRRADVNAFGMVGFVDGHLDLMYFAEGTMVSIGVASPPCHELVHRANMAKLWEDGLPHYNAFGKVVKPPGWAPPDIFGELVKQGWEPRASSEGKDMCVDCGNDWTDHASDCPRFPL
jgi:predicted HAD superfamily Cof-like phosphohydrolase